MSRRDNELAEIAGDAQQLQIVKRMAKELLAARRALRDLLELMDEKKGASERSVERAREVLRG